MLPHFHTIIIYIYIYMYTISMMLTKRFRPTYVRGTDVWDLPVTKEDETHQDYSYVVPALKYL